MFVNGLIFHVTASNKIKFCTSKKGNKETMKPALECLKAVVRIHNDRNFKIRTALGNEEFDPSKPILENEHNINFNPMSANEHIAEVECMMQVIKE